MNNFVGVEELWTARMASLRQVVRQHVLRAQLQQHLSGVQTVLDVGCGQGTQAVELAKLGLHVTGVDPSPDLLAQMGRLAAANDCLVKAFQGDLDSLDPLLRGSQFDLVCAHGLLMYLPDARSALAKLTSFARPGGWVSFTVRNGDALAYRPGVRGDWRAALDAFGADSYVNELGAAASAVRLDDVLGWCAELGLSVERWYGVRVFTDGRSADEVPNPKDLDDCLAAEVEAGARDPYRRFGSQLHVVAQVGEDLSRVRA